MGQRRGNRALPQSSLSPDPTLKSLRPDVPVGPLGARPVQRHLCSVRSDAPPPRHDAATVHGSPRRARPTAEDSACSIRRRAGASVEVARGDRAAERETTCNHETPDAEPAPRTERPSPATGTSRAHENTPSSHDNFAGRASTPYIDWATLMKRGMGIDVLSRPRCTSRLTPIGPITEPDVSEKILVHVTLPLRPEQLHDGMTIVYDVTASLFLTRCAARRARTTNGQRRVARRRCAVGVRVATTFERLRWTLRARRCIFRT